MSHDRDLWAVITSALPSGSTDEALALERALESAGALVPSERTVAALSRASCNRCVPLLGSLSASNLLTLPRNTGSAGAVLLAFLSVFRRMPSARFLLLPADSAAPGELLERSHRALIAASHNQDNRVVLLGARGRGTRGRQGLIVPAGSHDGRSYEVLSYVADPGPLMAPWLLDRPVLWGSYVAAAASNALLRLYDNALPWLLKAFLADLPAEDDRDTGRLDRLFAVMPSADFATHVLEPSPDHLRVVVEAAPPRVGRVEPPARDS